MEKKLLKPNGPRSTLHTSFCFPIAKERQQFEQEFLFYDDSEAPSSDHKMLSKARE